MLVIIMIVVIIVTALRSTPRLSRPNKASLAYIHLYVCLFTKVLCGLSDSNKIWLLCRQRSISATDGMPCDPIQGQGQGHVRNSSIFKVYLLRHLQWELAND